MRARAIMGKDHTSHTENAQEYRSKAAACAETARTARSLKQGGEARKREQAYVQLAENEDWLAKNSDKLV